MSIYAKLVTGAVLVILLVAVSVIARKDGFLAGQEAERVRAKPGIDLTAASLTQCSTDRLILLGQAKARAQAASDVETMRVSLEQQSAKTRQKLDRVITQISALPITGNECDNAKAISQAYLRNRQ